MKQNHENDPHCQSEALQSSLSLPSQIPPPCDKRGTTLDTIYTVG